MADKEENLFTVRVEEALKGTYNASMRRFIQTISLYEADRCLKNRYKVLRPFQRKIALYDVCADLIETLKFIPDYHRVSIMFRTASGKIPLTPELAWRRMKQVDKDIEKTITPELATLFSEDIPHDEVCQKYIQKQFEKHPTGQEGLNCPDGWEHSHLHTFMVYKMYYNGAVLDPDIPTAVDPNPYRVVPKEKPKIYPPELALVTDPAHVSSLGKEAHDFDDKDDKDEDDSDGEDASSTGLVTLNVCEKRSAKRSISSPLDQIDRAAQMRRSMLQEVREHLNLLKDFEDVISETELNERKKDLFQCLPPPPPSMVTKRDIVINENDSLNGGNKKIKTDQELKEVKEK